MLTGYFRCTRYVYRCWLVFVVGPRCLCDVTDWKLTLDVILTSDVINGSCVTCLETKHNVAPKTAITT